MKIPVHPTHKVIITKRNGRKNMVPYAWRNVNPNVLQTTTRVDMREHSKFKARRATSRRTYAAHQGSHIPPGAAMVGTRLRASDGLFLWVFIMVLHERHKGLTGA